MILDVCPVEVKCRDSGEITAKEDREAIAQRFFGSHSVRKPCDDRQQKSGLDFQA